MIICNQVTLLFDIHEMYTLNNELNFNIQYLNEFYVTTEMTLFFRIGGILLHFLLTTGRGMLSCMTGYIPIFIKTSAEYVVFSSPGHRPCELLSWVSIRRPSIVVRRLSSVVRQLFTFKSSSLKPLNRFEPNLAEMFIGWSYTRNLFLALIGNPTWLPGPIMCSDWSKF